MTEINRRPVGIDGLPFEAYVDPLGHGRWNPNTYIAFPELNPIRTLQERMAHLDQPDPTQEVILKDRAVEQSTVGDRLIQRAILKKLQASLDEHFSEASCGFRPGRSPEKAIVAVRDAIRAGSFWCLKTDVEECFPSIRRTMLEHLLSDALEDQELVRLILQHTSPCLVTIRGKALQREDGLPQGNGLTPFLCNLYLHPLDQACSHLLYFRYADDLVVLRSSRGEVLEAERLIGSFLALLGLRMNRKKTRIANLHREAIVFLGYEIKGGNIYPPPKAVCRLERKLRVRGQEARRQLMASFVRRYEIGPVRKLFRRLDRRLRPLYPPGLTLVGLLDANRMKSSKGVGASRKCPTHT